MNDATRTPHRPLRQRLAAPFAVAGLALTALAASPAQAAPPEDRARRDGHGMCERIKCTDDQREEMKQVRRELGTDLEADRQAIKELQSQIAAEFAKDKPDEKKMKRLYAKVDQHRDNMRDRTHDAMMELHALLTPEQRKQVADAMAKRGPKALMGGGKGKGKGKKGKKGKKGEKGEKGERKAN